MNPLVTLLLTKLLELLCEKAEAKFKEAKKGEDKKAYVLNKVDKFLDDEAVAEAKTDAIEFAVNKIEDVVEKVINRK